MSSIPDIEKLIALTARIMRGRKVQCVLCYGAAVSPPRWLHLLDNEKQIQDTWKALTLTSITVKRSGVILDGAHTWETGAEYELHVETVTRRLLALFPRLCPRGALVNLMALGGEELSLDTRAAFEGVFGGLSNAVIAYMAGNRKVYEHRGMIPSTSVVPLLIGIKVVNGVVLNDVAVACLWARVYANDVEYAFHETLPCVGSSCVLNVRVEIPVF